MQYEFGALADGRRLAARLWIPNAAKKKPVPAILEYLPYRKRDGTAQRDDSTYPAFAEAGADILTVHPEAGPHTHRSLQLIKSLGKKAGISLNPGTPVSVAEPMLGEVDLVLVMSVNPGFGGQSFIPGALDKIAALRDMIDRGGRTIDLEVDGGINAETARQATAAGADLLVAGTATFKGGPARYADNIARLRGGAS